VQWEIQEYDEWSIENIEERERDLIEDSVTEKWDTPDTRLTDIEAPEDAISELTEEELSVLRALCEYSNGRARRVIHRKATELDTSPFANPGDNDERSTVGSILSRLVGLGLAERQNRTWYPTEEALAAELKVRS